MTLNQTYTPELPKAMGHERILRSEQEEAQVTTAQQNAATLLYLKNRQEIWSTDESAMKGSLYSERLEEIIKGDERICDISVDVGNEYDILPSMVFLPKVRFNLSTIENMGPGLGYFDPKSESLRQCKSEVNEVTRVLNEVKSSKSRRNVIPILENAFDRLDDVKLLLDALHVDQSLGPLKSEILSEANNVSIAIERVAQDLNSHMPITPTA